MTIHPGSRACIAACLLTAAPAAQAVVLVSNIAEPVRATTLVESALWAAQSFVNDGNSWSFSNIRTVIGDAVGGPDVVAELHQGAAPGTSITTFTVPGLAGPTGIKTILPLSAVTLAPGETYWLVFGVDGGGSFGWSYAEGNGQTGTGSLGSYAYSFDQGATWGSFGPDNPYLIEVNVTLVPETAAWALMIGGFGLAGAALRSRRRALAQA